MGVYGKGWLQYESYFALCCSKNTVECQWKYVKEANEKGIEILKKVWYEKAVLYGRGEALKYGN